MCQTDDGLERLTSNINSLQHSCHDSVTGKRKGRITGLIYRVA